MRRAAGLVILLALAPAPARADMGPRFEDQRVLVRITRQGKPLSEPFEPVLLAHAQANTKLDEWWGNNSPWLKEIDSALPDADGVTWLPPWWPRGYERTGPGAVTFHFRDDRSPLPPRVRVALRLPDERRVVVTNAVPTRPYITELTVDLAADGTASLADTPTSPPALVLGVLADNVRSLGVALLATILLELLVVGVCSRFRKGTPGGRLFGAVVLGNLITVPLVWFVSVYAKVQMGPGGWPLLFGLAELAAIAFEGWLYYRVARVPFGPALLWSAIANNVTLVVGCCLVALTV